MFSSLPAAKPDPLFAIAAEARAAGPTCIDGTLGVYMDEEGKPLMLPSVGKAMNELGKTLKDFNCAYPPLTGLPSYRSAVHKLIATESDIVASIASTGGTGALAINLRLMSMLLGSEKPNIILPTPAWANHMPVCKWAGFTVIETPYLVNKKASIDAIADTIKKQSGKFGIMLQVGCHNPTGLDLADADWPALIKILQTKECVVLLDFAYQGFKGEPEADAVAIRLCREAGLTTLVTWSASKNHSIYGLRTGLAAAFVNAEDEKKTVEGTYSVISRGLHSAAPTFGQAVVALTQEKYRTEWLKDLADARAMMSKKRKLLIDGLPPSCTPALSGYGMFAMLPLSPEQVTRLKTEHNAFVPLDGRVNIAGIPLKRIGELCEKVKAVL